MRRVDLGPFLGHVTSADATVFIRPRERADAPRLVRSEPASGRTGRAATAEAELVPLRGGSGVLVGRVPLRGGPALHRLRVEGFEREALVRPALPPSREGTVAFAFGSCWRVDAVGDPLATWRTLHALAVTREVEHLLLLGDQVYADQTPLPCAVPTETAAARARRMGPASPLERRADGYRDATQWSFEPDAVQRVLARLPTTCTWDDHEITNGWGSFGWHGLPDGRAVFEAAALAFDEMQASRNPPPLEPGSRAHGFVRGPAAFLTLDLRTHRDHASGVLLGSAQRAAVDAFLAGEASEVPLLVLSSSVPPLHLTRAFHWLRGLSDVRDQWGVDAYEDERAWLFARLVEHAEGGRRRVVVLGGDVHLATAVRAAMPWGDPLWQLSSSPLAHRLPAVVYPALTLFGRRFSVRTASGDALPARVIARWSGPNVGVVRGSARERGADLTFELYRPGRRTALTRL